MPSIPSRKLSKLWSGNSSKPLASPETETLPTENDKTSLEDSWAKEPSHPSQLRLKQFFPEKDKESDGLAADIRLRRKTNERLYAAVEAYWSSLNKSKPLPFEMSTSSALEIAMTLDEAKAACQTSFLNTSPLVIKAAEEGSKGVANGKERVLPIEALGLAMASCASTYSRLQKEDSENKMHLKKNEAYVAYLSHLSAVHLALAQLQADYTSSLSSTLLNRLARSQAAIEALGSTEKGTEAAREKMEAAEKRRDKAREKGEKNRRDAEEEARMARATYEEALADLEVRTDILRDSEQRGPGSGVAILKEYMDVHLAWVQAQHEVLSKARASLDQYPAHSNATTNLGSSTKTRAAPPPPPPSAQTVPRRIAEPPPTFRDEQRKRSVSSAQMLHKPKISSRASLNDVLLKSRSSREEERAQRPSSRAASSTKEAASSSRSTLARLPFARSESYSAIDTRSDALESEPSNKNEGKKSRMGILGTAFQRSSSSLGYTSPETTKTTPSTTGGTGTDFSGSEKGSSWASNLLSRKRDAKKDSSYTVMTGSEHEVDLDRPVRSLSHVQETSTESKSNGLDDVFFVHHAEQPSLVESSSDNFKRQDAQQFKTWEKFGDRRDSLGISSHLTGNTVSSEGSNPFGNEGGELSPVGTGNGNFSSLTRDSFGYKVGRDEDNPADRLLSDMSSGTVRKKN